MGIAVRVSILLLIATASCGFPRPPHLDPDDASVGADDAPRGTDGAPGFVPCQLTAVTPSIASTDDTISLEGSFADPVMVNFPGGAPVVATVLGPHRATATVPASAATGNLTISGCGTTTGSIPFRRASFAPGLGMFQSSFDQGDGAQQTTTLVTTRSGHTSQVTGSSVFVLGGTDGRGDLSSVERAGINADGSLAPFATISGVSLVTAREAHTTVLIGQYLYVIGGLGNGSPLNSIERATVGPDGSLGRFAIVPGVELTVPRQGHTSLVIGNYLYVLGGFNTSSLNSAERAIINIDGSLNPFEAVSGVTLVGARHGHTTAIVGNTLYTIGGERGNTTLQDVERATINADGSLGPFSVVAGASLMDARSGHATSLIGKALYVFGGTRSNTALSSVERAPLASDGTLAPFAVVPGIRLTTARHDYATAEIGNYLYVLGGAGVASLSTIERATVNASGSVETFATSPGGGLPGPLSNHVTVVIGNHAYVLGGLYTEVSQATISADGSLGAFATTPGVALNTARSQPTTAVVGKNLYVVGGINFDTFSSPLNSIEKATINPDGTLGSFVTQSVVLNNARYGHTSAVIGNHLYIVGGTAGGAVLSDVERATINQDGSLGPFAIVSGVNLVTARNGQSSAVLGGYLYVLGGTNTIELTSVERAAINNSDGSLGQFATVAGVKLQGGLFNHTNAVIGTYLYVIGGETLPSGGVEFFPGNVERATILADGSLGSFTTLSGIKLRTPRASHSTIVSGNYLYALGGNASSSTTLSSIERATLSADGVPGSFRAVYTPR